MREMINQLNIICLESEAFYSLLDEIILRVTKDLNVTSSQKWINDVQAMGLLNITSKTTLQKYRDEGKIRYSQMSKKVILYDRDSILAFIEQNVKEAF